MIGIKVVKLLTSMSSFAKGVPSATQTTSCRLKIILAGSLLLIIFCLTLVILNVVQDVKLKKARSDLHNIQITNSVAVKEITFESEKKDIVSNFIPIKKRIENIEDEELSHEVKTILFDVRYIYYSSFTN